MHALIAAAEGLLSSATVASCRRRLPPLPPPLPAARWCCFPLQPTLCPTSPQTYVHADENAEGVSPCSTCGRVGFCSAACAAAAADDPGSHCTAVCRLLAACNTEGLTEEQQSALQLLTRVCSLRAAAAGGGGGGGAAARLAGLASLAAPPGAAAADVSTRELHGRLSHALVAVGAAPAAALSLEEVTALLARDAANGYGIMAPSAPDVSCASISL